MFLIFFTYVLLHVVVLCFLQVFEVQIMHIAIGKKGHRFQLYNQFLLLGQDMVMTAIPG